MLFQSKSTNSIFFKRKNFFLLEFNLPTYSITPSAHPIKCLPQWMSLSYSPHPRPPLFPLPLVRFPELGVSHVLSPSLIFPTHFFPFSFIPFHYFLYSTNERESHCFYWLCQPCDWTLVLLSKWENNICITGRNGFECQHITGLNIIS